MGARFVLPSLCLPGLYATGLPGWTLRPAGGCASPHDRRAEHNDDGSRGSFAIWLLPVSGICLGFLTVQHHPAEAKQLLDHLEGVLSNEPVEVVAGSV